MDIGEQNEKIARATVTTLDYEHMVAQIKAVTDSCATNGNSAVSQEVKVEPDTLVARGQNWQRGSFRGRAGNYRGGSGSYNGGTYNGNNRSSYAGNRSTGSNRGAGNNLSNNGFNNRRCFICNSPEHLSYNCPRKANRPVSENSPKCFKCNSNTHLTYACPVSQTTSENCDAINIVLLQSTYSASTGQFLLETFGSAVIDSGAKTNVAGKLWIDRYIESLSDQDVHTIREEKCVNKFMFGDGKEVLSDVRITLPVTIAGDKQFLSTSVISSDLPLLLSFESLNRNNAVIDFGRLTMNLGGKELSLKRTSYSGHLLLPLSPFVHNSNIVLHVKDLEKLSSSDKEKKMIKLHKQLGHPSKESMFRLLKSSGLKDSGLFEAVVSIIKACPICIKFQKKPSRPCVSLPLSDGFNSTVALDLKTVVKDKLYIIHLICLGTRFSMAGIIRSKNADVILNAVLKLWVQYFGSPRRLLSDNGAEFSNDKFRELCEQLNIVNTTTPGESPWSNGVVERHNGILMETVRRVMDECQCSLESALPWAICAKNTLSNVSGYSPNVLVFGRNPNFPSVLIDDVPALSPCTHSELVRSNLQIMHSARKCFVAAESSERIRRALRMKLRTSNDLVVENGDSVFYRRENFKGWKGPGTVIGRDGKLVVVRHGGLIYRVPVCHIIHTSKARDLASDSVEVTCSDEVASKSDHSYSDSDSSDELVGPLVQDANAQVNALEDSVLNDDNAVVNNRTVGSISDEVLIDDQPDVVDLRNGSELPLVNSTVRFKTKDGDDWHTATILSRGGKSGGRNKSYLNVHVEGEELPKGVHWDQHVDVWKSIDSVENIVLFSKTDELREPVIAAKEAELDNWKSNNVFHRVKDVGQPAISSRWVLAEKGVPGSKDFRIKARLVCRGYEEDTSCVRTDSPTCSKESMRLLLCVAMSKRWECKSLDIKSAFLQGFNIERDIFMRPPGDVEEKGVLWKLVGCPYGLNDAPRSWYRRVKSEFLNLKVTPSRYDEAFFYYKVQGVLHGVVVVHVDDFLYCGSVCFQNDVIAGLVKVFKVRVQSCGNFKYLGLNFTQSTQCVQLDQNVYVQGLETISITEERELQRGDLLTPLERAEVKSKTGQLLWVSGNTRPDISFETSVLCNPGPSATVESLVQVNKVISKLKQSPGVVKYVNLGDFNSWSLKVFSDSSHANLSDGSSQGGHIIFLHGEDGRVSPIAWQSKKLHRVTRSTLASETLSTIEAVDVALLLRRQLSEMLSIEPKVTVFIDCKSLYQMIQTSKVIEDKSLRVNASYLRQLYNRGEINISWVHSEMQLADPLTKLGTSCRKLREVLHRCYF